MGCCAMAADLLHHVIKPLRRPAGASQRIHTYTHILVIPAEPEQSQMSKYASCTLSVKDRGVAMWSEGVHITNRGSVIFNV